MLFVPWEATVGGGSRPVAMAEADRGWSADEVAAVELPPPPTGFATDSAGASDFGATPAVGAEGLVVGVGGLLRLGLLLLLVVALRCCRPPLRIGEFRNNGGLHIPNRFRSGVEVAADGLVDIAAAALSSSSCCCCWRFVDDMMMRAQ